MSRVIDQALFDAIPADGVFLIDSPTKGTGRMDGATLASRLAGLGDLRQQLAAIAAVSNSVAGVVDAIDALQQAFANLTLADNSVGNAKLAQAPAMTFKGNGGTAAGNVTDLTVQQVKALLSYAVTDISGLATMLASKADGQSTATALAGKADLQATNIALASKADGAATASALATKADAAATTQALGLKANSADVATSLATKASTTDLSNGLAGKANTSDVNTALAAKANTVDVTAALATKAPAAQYGYAPLSMNGKVAASYLDVDLSTVALKATTFTGTGAVTGGGDLSANRTFDVALNGIDNARLAQMPAATFKGNATGAAANAADLTPSQVKAVLGIMLSDVSGIIDPSTGKFFATLVPPTTANNIFTAASQAEMLAEPATSVGDLCIRTDTSQTFVFRGGDPTKLSNWVLLPVPTNPITSVNGQTSGAIVTRINDIVDAGATGKALLAAATPAAAKATLAIVASDVTDSGATGRSLLQAATPAAAKGTLAIAAADITDAGATGQALLKAASASIAKAALALVTADITDAGATGQALLKAATATLAKAALALTVGDLTDAGATGKALVQAATPAAAKATLAITGTDVAYTDTYAVGATTSQAALDRLNLRSKLNFGYRGNAANFGTRT